MRYPAAETAEKHDRILVEATRLFRENGLTGVSVGDIMKAAGLTSGSFYHHFPSKESLISACIEHAVGEVERRLESIEPSAAGKSAYIEWYLSADHRDNCGAGCHMSILASEIARHPDVKPSMSHYVQSYISKLASYFPWPSKRHARRDAIRTTAALVGAIVLARSVDDEILSQEIMSSVIAELTEKTR